MRNPLYHIGQRGWLTVGASCLCLGLVSGGCGSRASAPPAPTLQLHRIAAPSGEYAVYSSFDTGRGTYVRALKVDGNTLWVGTSRGILAVNHQTGDLIQTYTRASVGNRMASDYIFTINVDPRDGVKWFGTNNGGLVRYDSSTPADRQWANFLPVNGLADFWVYGIDFDAHGTMWVGTWDGVSRYDPRAAEGKRFTTYNERDGLANRWVYAVAVDRDQSVWFGTESGVSRFDTSAPSGRQWRTWRHQDGLGAPNLLALKRSQNTGMGTMTGGYRTRHDLSVLDEKGKETYNENYVFCIAIDRDGVKWIGTWGGGLSRFDFDGTDGNGRWKNYSQRDGLAGNIVYAIAIDPHGVFWVGTNHGLSRFDPAAAPPLQWKSWTKADGLLGDDVYAIAPAPTGTIWLGQKGGVVELRPVQGPQRFEG
ncbi:MAG TPA: two-component regulator propeller domain-containing protein [Nitrospiria bacterium]|nr:two-component regulator propeller domain-containing protein [Nitrospiria bacterium]